MYSVSFIMASFNCGKYIERAISSALNQYDCNIELIIVDDASTDNTQDILNSLTDDRVKVIKLDHNRGASYARNIAMEHATHEWVAILDSDDWCDRERVTRLLSFAHTHNVDIVADDQRLIDGCTGKMLGVRSERVECLGQDSVLILEDVIKYSSIGIIQPIFRRRLLKELDFYYDESLRYGEDYEFLVRLIERSHKIGIVKDSYYNVTVRGDSLVANRVEMFQGMVEVFCILSRKKYIAESGTLSEYVRGNINDAESTIIYGHVVESLRSRNLVKTFRYATRYAFIKQIPYRSYVFIIKKVASYVGKDDEKNSSCY